MEDADSTFRICTEVLLGEVEHLFSSVELFDVTPRSFNICPIRNLYLVHIVLVLVWGSVVGCESRLSDPYPRPLFSHSGP